jgi:oligoendopeptidase F
MDWDLSSYFNNFNGPTYKAFKSELAETIEELTKRAEHLLSESELDIGQWEALIIDYEHLHASVSHLGSYIGCLTSAQADNEDYLKEEVGFSNTQASLSKLGDKLIRGIGLMDEEAFEDLLSRGRLQDAGFFLKDLREQSKHRMPGELEALAAELGVDGISAWSRLYFTSMGNLKFRYEDPESGEKEVPMAQLNSLLSNPDRNRRKSAYQGSIKTFSEHQQTYAAALNAISGTRHTLNKRRGVDGFLDTSLRQSRIKETTLNALMAAIEGRLPFAREVFKFRTDCMGIEDPGYVDLRAPLPLTDEGGPEWKDGVSLVSKAFNAAYPSLGEFFDEVIQKKWVDYTPRDSKRPGGFCTGSLITRESRIFMTYKDTLNDVITLAHEAGHAWHSRVLKDQRILASRYPMTLAETASTFAERILTEGVLSSDEYDNAMKLVLLDAEVEHMLAFLLDLPVRFRFEEAVYKERKSGALSASDFCELMSETQRTIFGDALSVGGEDPWFWASKLHFYIEGVQFYNYPYTFGYLLSTAYINRMRESPESTLNLYEQFLGNSGKMSCEEAVQSTLGEDIEDPNFWAELIDGLQRPFGQYKDLIKEFSE